MTRAGESNARGAEKAAVIAELSEFAERLHHLALNCSLAAFELDDPDERDRVTRRGIAFSFVEEWMQRRIAELGGQR
jgi:hypothetical protein